jgi:hypothetical protein
MATQVAGMYPLSLVLAVGMLVPTAAWAAGSDFGTGGSAATRMLGSLVEETNFGGAGQANAEGVALLVSTPYWDGPNQFFASALATAKVSTRGALSVSATATAKSAALVGASFFDRVDFFAPAGWRGSTLHVVETMHVTGTLINDDGGYAYSNAFYWSSSVYSKASTGGSTISEVHRQYGSIVPGPTDFDLSLALDLPVVDGQAHAFLSFALAVAADSGCNECNLVLDFSHTGTVSQALPAGWTFGSASGQFLQPVPEPATQALMLAGLGWVGWVWRRRQTRSTLN